MKFRTVKLKKYSDVQKELIASGAITPGMLLERTSTANTVKAHSVSGGNAAPKMFALEDELQGKDIDDAYANADKVQVWVPYPGDEVAAILADGENVSIGDLLESNGAGYLQKHVADVESFESNEAGSLTVYPAQIVGVALEAIDMSDSSGGESEDSGGVGYNRRIKIEIV